VQVVPTEAFVGEADERFDSVRQLAAMVVNRGRFTIARIEAQFNYDGMSLVSHQGAGFATVPEGLRAGGPVRGARHVRGSDALG
jgi:hypothetical protein